MEHKKCGALSLDAIEDDDDGMRRTLRKMRRTWLPFGASSMPCSCLIAVPDRAVPMARRAPGLGLGRVLLKSRRLHRLQGG
jgi:hypothetical protein